MEKNRPYRMHKRARSQDETRRRIVEATMQLHQELGPRATTISAIAERAGVQRLTVYRHFPDETAVFEACTSHWLSLNPPPDPQTWAGIDDPWERLRHALSGFYDYYAATECMWTFSHQDVAAVTALQRPMAEFAAFVDGVAGDLARAFHARKRQSRSVKITLRHALVFPTWADLQAQGTSNRRKAELIATWLDGQVHEQRK
jgi:AcrR family transcriptional regulator